MKLFDIGVNLLSRQFRQDRLAIIERARQHNVDTLLVTGTDLDMVADALLLSQQDNIFCTAGVHPHYAKDVADNWIEQLVRHLSHPGVRAIGETGLDYNRNLSPPDVQRAVFAQQLEIAEQWDMPLFLHDRESQGDLLRMLDPSRRSLRGVVHCFTGSREELESYLAAGLYIGITGWITDTQRGQNLRSLISEIPLERLLLETDAPYLLPQNVATDFVSEFGLKAKYKRRNEPALLRWVLKAVAELRGESEHTIAAATYTNARTLFAV